jgi:nucleoside-diphosphate-sugar epimerase
MGLHVIVGAGPVGRATAQLLAERGETVKVVSRRGTEVAGARAVASDATDAAALREIVKGADALYNCANPKYHRWPVDWPPLHEAMLAAAEDSGAVLAITGNLYGYGPVDGPMTERLPLRPNTVKGGVRAQMWHSALAAHEAGRIRATEVRGSDYIGVGAYSLLTDMVLTRVVAGKTALVPANVDLPHSFTYTGDVARALVAVATDERAWGRAWHAPTNPAVTIREAATIAARLAGHDRARVRRMPGAVLWLGGLFDPGARGFREMRYQFERPFVLDSTETERTFGLRPTPLEAMLRETVETLCRPGD